MDDLRFPLGEFELPGPLTARQRNAAIQGIDAAPKQLREAVEGLSAEQLDTSYRLDGWTVRQVVHHILDSQLNGYLRLKWALTEDQPTIRTYEENSWADLVDSAGPVEMSLDLFDSLGRRWVYLLERLEETQWSRRSRHPDMGIFRVDELAALYDWHGRHHIAHITSLRQRRGW